jgi:3-phenylpropionate/trans-cinnamate dioxygenase ferredoxin subunit
MVDFVDAVKADEVDPETACVVEVDGREIAIVHTGGEFYALQNECTHAGSPIGEGDLVGEGIVECVGHASTFNVVTGEPLDGPATEPLETYDVEVVDGTVRVSIE